MARFSCSCGVAQIATSSWTSIFAQHSSPWAGMQTFACLESRESVDPFCPGCTSSNAISTVRVQVCDHRCGSGLYGDLHCNWMGLGQTCRLCFEDSSKALLAEKMAEQRGDDRVILCTTHEPPTQLPSDDVQLAALENASVHDGTPASSSAKTPPLTDTDEPGAIVYTGNITRGQICVFMRGYFDFFSETKVSVDSVLHFMPGVRVRIATSPTDFHVFNR